MASPSKRAHQGKIGSPKPSRRSSIAQPSRPCASQYTKLNGPDKTSSISSSQPNPVIPARSLHRSSASTSTRQISASFSTNGPLSANPTTACSNVVASTMLPHPGPLTSHPVYPSADFPSSQSLGNIREPGPRGSLNSSQTYSNLPMPSTHHKSYSSTASIARSYTHAAVVPARNRENIPPSTSIASNLTKRMDISKPPTPRLVDNSSPKKKSKSRLSVTRSRTFNALSNLTASLSRTSFGQLSGDHSRHASGSSKSTAHKTSGPYGDTSLAASSSSKWLLVPNNVDSTDPNFVHKAQSSSYWSGRFVALEDRFQSEMLRSENLEVLGHAYSQRSFSTQPSIASSATMSCIAPAPRANSSSRPSGTKSTSPRKHQQKLEQVSEYGDLNTTQSYPIAPNTLDQPPSYEATTALLVDEDNRGRRIFMHLEALCTTSEARKSLHQWQQSYARRTGRESLLPEGGTMHEVKERTWVGRLFMGNGAGNGYSK